VADEDELLPDPVIPRFSPEGAATGSDDDRLRHIEDLIQTIKESADKLAADGSSRGDLKLISRTLRELRYAFKVFAPYRKRRKVTVFGSARTKPEEPSYQEAVKLGRAFAEQNWLVVTGAAAGIMLPFEQEANPVIRDDHKLVHMKYFFTRKLMFVKECDAVVCLPGGFGTLDEGMEVITLLQTGKRDMVPVVLLDPPGGKYWADMNEFLITHLLGNRLISPEDQYLYKVCDDYQVAIDEVMQFFKVYHSMRYVKRDLVLRLNEPLDPMLLEAINANFKDILVDGTFTQRDVLPAEKDEPDLLQKARLVFTFNRRNFGRLRLLIDSINLGQIAPTRFGNK
jgi:predicted Rossmann-fold nucleotide-binding protein